MVTAARRRPEPSRRTQKILTIVLAVLVVGTAVALIIADRYAPPRTSPPVEQPIP